MTEPALPIVLYDGLCSFCDFWVRFIIRHDKKAVFRFAAFQSPSGQQLCIAHGIDPENQNSIALIDPEGVRRKSDAVLAIVERLGGAWKWVSVLRIVPHSWRDATYDFVARNRYRWFGRRIACRVPPDDHRSRFLP